MRDEMRSILADGPLTTQSLRSASSSRVAAGTPSATSDAKRLSMAGRNGALLLKLEGMQRLARGEVVDVEEG